MQTLHLLAATVLIFFGGLLLPAPLPAQEIRTNEKGEKIIVYPDGSWQYFTIFGGSKDVLFDPKDAPSAREESDFASKYPVFRGEIAPMDLALAIPEEYARKIAVRKAQIAAEARDIAQKRASEAQNQLQKLEQDLIRLRQQNAPEADVQRLQLRLESARKTQQETQQEVAIAQRTAAEADQLTQKGVYLKQLRSQRKSELKANKAPSVAGATLQSADLLAGLALADMPPGTLNTAELLYNAPSPGCRIAFEGVDPELRQYRRDVQKQTFFTYTDERLRRFLKDKEYLRCEGYATSIGGYRFISLQFSFAYPNAREAYGFIEKGSILTIKLLDGNFINLRSGKMDRGSYNTQTGVLTYSVHYPIDRSQINLLRQSEVDSVLVFWSSGYEEYEVFEIDFFINQLTCLEK